MRIAEIQSLIKFHSFRLAVECLSTLPLALLGSARTQLML